jgi:hypothetical protein
MTVIVSVKINDGVVMAADSAGSMESGQIYAHANKIANLCGGLPIGAMSTESGGIGNESVETLFKDLRRRSSGLDPMHADWKIDPHAYTIGQAAQRLRSFLFEEKAQAPPGSDQSPGAAVRLFRRARVSRGVGSQHGGRHLPAAASDHGRKQLRCAVGRPI